LTALAPRFDNERGVAPERHPGPVALTLKRLPWRLTLDLARREVERRYRGSFLGLGWVVLGPFLLLGIYTFVYSVVLGVRIPGQDRLGFVVWLYAGLNMFTLFSDVLTAMPAAIRNNPNYVKRMIFPLEALIWARLFAALFFFAVNTSLLVLFVVVTQRTVHGTLLLVPVLLVPIVLLAGGIGTVLATLGVFVRDVDEIIRPGLRVLFYATPIAYPEAMVPAGVRWLLRLNPLTGLVENYRRLVVFGTEPEWASLAVLAVAATLLLWAGQATFHKLRPGFADVI
jgi:lipopolysaccharide transport system permease protein